MYWFLLKKALPFTLTFIFGAVLSGFAGLFMRSEKKAEMVGLRYRWGVEDGRGHNHCRMRQRNLVAESKPLTILYKPEARRPPVLRGTDKENINSFWVSVTFGADGKVQAVKPTGEWTKAHVNKYTGSNEIAEMVAIMSAVEGAAREIRFEPEMVNSVPVTSTADVEISFMAD